MRTKLFTLAYILLSCLGLNAREITGVVMDDKSSPIEFASITAFANDSVVGGGVSDVSGIFRIDVGQECNRVRVSYVGYNDMIISPVASDLGNIILTQKSTTLKEVVVKAPLIRRDADRIILNVAANPLSANKDAQELLKTAPGVWATDDALSIYGQGGTAVYIDDRKVNMSGCIDNVDTILLPVAGCSGGGDCDTSLLLLLHPVHRSSTVVNFAELMCLARIEKYSFRSGGLTRIDMSHYTNISGTLKWIFSRHI